MNVAIVHEPGVAVETILVVDDEPAVRALFARTLRDAGFDSLEAADGVEAVELLGRHQVDLVLLDSTMPRLGGIDLIRMLRARPDTSTLPIILVTAKADLEDRVLGLEAGADDYLPKPVALDELEARVRAQLRSHAAWVEASEREATQRRAMTATLRRIETDGTPEAVASELVEQLMPVLDLEALALACLLPDGSVVPLAAAGRWAGLVVPGHPAAPDLARSLRAHTADGPWIIDSIPAEGGSPAKGGAIVALPLSGRAGPFGLLALRVPGSADGTREVARRMPLFMELADLTGAALHAVLDAGGGRLQERAALLSVIDARAFTPHFQPIVTLADRRPIGHEALTRFADGTRPDQRFAEALRLDLGGELERATLQAAVEAARSLPAGTMLGLNVSPVFALAGELPAILADADRDIVIELTEHAPIEDYTAVRAALARIRPPVQVAVDDAGSGYASLRHILALQPAFVKLDISWVRGIEADPARQALVAGLVHFATEVGCQLVGEGIETEAECATLQRHGVPLGQGYLLGRPAPAPAPGSGTG